MQFLQTRYLLVLPRKSKITKAGPNSILLWIQQFDKWCSTVRSKKSKTIILTIQERKVKQKQLQRQKALQAQLQAKRKMKAAEKEDAERKAREIGEAQAARRSQMIRRSLKLVIGGKTVPMIQITSTKAISSESWWYFKNSQHFIYYDGCPIDDCAICLQASQKGAKMTHLFCRHVLHTQCLWDWLRMKNDCPLCKQDFRQHEEYRYVRSMLSDKKSYEEWKATQMNLKLKIQQEERKQRQLRKAQLEIQNKKLREAKFRRQNERPLFFNGKQIPFIIINPSNPNPRAAHLLKSWKHFRFNGEFSAKSCSICRQSHQKDQILTRLHCGHIFHTCCVEEWVKVKSSCPTCHSDFPHI